MIIYPKEKWHFREYIHTVQGKTRRHPAYIVGEDGDNFLAFILTHSPMRSKRHPNYKLKQNPNSKDKRKAYLRRNRLSLSKRRFSAQPLEDMRMSEEDMAYVYYLSSSRNK